MGGIMRGDFITFFGGAEAAIRLNARDRQWLVILLDEEAEGSLRRDGLRLRSDAFVFLFHNMLMMVITPWESAERRNFVEAGMGEVLRSDVRRIFRLAAELSMGERREEVSANAVFQAIAQLGEDLRIRAEEFWGP